MTGFVMFLHALICALLITIILMQSGRGGGLTEAFSSAETMFGAKTNVYLIKGTTIFACFFLVTSISLAIVFSKNSASLMPEKVASELPSETATEIDLDELTKTLQEASQKTEEQETKNDPDFAKQLSELAEVYVNDAFGTAHRAHASTEGITKYLPSVAGFLLGKEIEYLGKAVEDPQKPFVVILGGAKVSDKIMLVENLIKKADSILVGGGMAYTFLKASGINIGNSLLEEDKIDVAKDLLDKAKEANVEMLISEDYVVSKGFDFPETKKIVEGDIPDGFLGLDIGPKTVERWKGCFNSDIIRNI